MRIESVFASRIAVLAAASVLLLVLTAVGVARGDPEPAVSDASEPTAGSTWEHPARIVVVDIQGAVRSPGVYELPDGARVRDLVDAAGGARSGAVLSAVNRAAPLVDGQQIVVPAAADNPVAAAAGGEALSAGMTGPVSINQADAAALEELPGIGPATAAAIIDDRTRNGPFTSIEDLERVPGIGPATVAQLESAASP